MSAPSATTRDQGVCLMRSRLLHPVAAPSDVKWRCCGSQPAGRAVFVNGPKHPFQDVAVAIPMLLR
jgi:hypothetical protein